MLETVKARIRLRAKFNAGLHRKVVVTQHAWWQACEPLGLGDYDPLSPDGANINLITSFDQRDPISGAVAHRSEHCRVRRIHGDFSLVV